MKLKQKERLKYSLACMSPYWLVLTLFAQKESSGTHEHD